MTFRSRSLLRRTTTVAAICVFTALAAAQAQSRWVVDPKGSLAWWQIDPHLSHLWGTTCPQEPSWRPGEGRSGGWTTEQAMNAKTLAHGFSDVSDTVHTPLYPRRRVRFVCSEAVQGEFLLPDTLKWRGAHGRITIDAKQIVTGENMRDKYEQNAILSVSVYPEITYALDSIADVTRKGDTLTGTAYGNWTMRSVTKPVSSFAKAYPEAGGMRLLTKFRIPVKDLVEEYGVWKRNLGLGVMMDIWKWLYMGVDLAVHPESQVRVGQ